MLIGRTMVPQPQDTTTLAAQEQISAHDLHELVWAMDLFAELVGAAGPLSHLRFDEATFAPCTTQLQAHQPLPAQSAEEAIEQAFTDHAARLCSTAMVKLLHRTLTAFERLPYIDASHRLAAQTARALTPRGGLDGNAHEAQAPALFVVFRAQMLQFLALDSDGLPLS